MALVMADPVDTLKPVQFDEVSPAEPITEPEVKPMKKTQPVGMKMILTLVIVVAGIGSGYFLNEVIPGKPVSGAPVAVAVPEDPNELEVQKIYGEKDAKKFPDEAEGVLVRGGVNGEGSHHLLRTGGPSRNVYMTSSVLDLSLFEDHLVKVSGETFQSQHAGWLMDVGRVEIVELNADKPFEEKKPVNSLLAE
jgi:hypothetical protein